MAIKAYISKTRSVKIKSVKQASSMKTIKLARNTVGVKFRERERESCGQNQVQYGKLAQRLQVL